MINIKPQFSLSIFIFFFVGITSSVLSQNTIYTSLYTTGTFTKTIDVGLPVGSIEASTDVNNGNGSYTIPLMVPAGTNGITPSLSLTYNSSGSNGSIGSGWSLSGMSAISRTGSNLYFEDIVKPVNYDAGDKFALDGSRLVLQAGTYGSNNATYATEVENFARFTSHGTYGSGPSYFVMETKDGVVMEFGNSTDSKYLTDDNTNIYFWRINKIIYKDGNYMEFKYTNTDRDSRIDEINYTGNLNTGLTPFNKIKFSYLIRDDINTTYDKGVTFRSKYLLDKIIITTEANTAFKSYEFYYAKNLVASFLKEIKEVGSDGTKFNSTIFKYGDEPTEFLTGSIPAVTTSGSGIGHNFIPGDFDGDGYTDILAARHELSETSGRVHTGFKIVKRTATSSSYTQSAYTDIPPGSGIIKGNNITFNYQLFTGDYTGDGRDDIATYNWEFVSGKRKFKYLEFFYSNGIGFNGNNKYFPPVVGGLPYYEIYPSFNFYWPGDFDGDGNMDYILVLSNGAPDAYKAFICFPSLSTNPQELIVDQGGGTALFPAFQWALADYVNVIDFDGDGKNEIMVTNDLTTKIYSFEKISGIPNAKIISNTGFPTKYHLLYFGDFNGDRKTDILTRTNLENINAQWYKVLSNGTSWLETPYTFSGHKPDVRATYNKDRLIISDYNGDGMSDLAVVWGLFPHYGANSGKFEMYYNKGDAFNSYIQSVYNPLLTAIPEYTFDLNGDAKADIINQNASWDPITSFSFKANGKERLLDQIKNGIGLTTQFVYKRMNEGGTFYNKTVINSDPFSASHEISTQLPMYLVSELRIQNGIGGNTITQFNYADARIHKEGRGFLGFMKVTSDNTSTGFRTVFENSINNTYITLLPSVSKTYLIASPTTALKEITPTYSLISLGSKRYWPKQTNIYENKIFEGQYVSTSMTYDNYGNVTASTTNVNGIETTSTSTSYGTFGTPMPAKPTYHQVTTTRSGETAYTATSAFVYNSLGQMLTKVEFPFTSKLIQTDYEYNTLGNQITITVKPSGMANRLTTLGYDTKGRFVINITNPLSQISSVINDVRWGKPTQSTGIDGLVTNYLYDGFGRLKTASVPQGYTITESYIWDQNIVDRTIYQHKIEHPGKPTNKTWYDILGRVVKEEVNGFNNLASTSKVTYDAKGNVYTTTLPNKSGESVLTTTNTYDAYNRPYTISNSLGTNTNLYSYSLGKLTTTTTNPASQVSSKTYDATNKMISSTDYGGTLDYSYYSHGNLKNVLSGGITFVTNEYDIYARKIKMTDVNAGVLLYEYDALGQLTKETNALSQMTSFTYDIIGRTLSEVKPEGTNTYEYYGSGTGASINRIKKITAFSGVLSEYTYDGFGRSLTVKETIDATSHTTTYGYNIYDDINTVTYPDGYGLNYDYDISGILKTIKNSTNTITLFANNTMNGLGKYTQYTLGNGKVSDNTYYFGIPIKYKTTGIQELNLVWNYQTGNLTSRQDVIKSKMESFTYDNLNRLLTSNITGQPTITMTYGSNGNINTKTDVGSYVYHPNKINAVKTINNPLNIPTLTQDIVYSSYNQPNSISEDLFLLQYTYAADEQRIKSVLKQGPSTLSTRYYMGNYEKEISGGITRHIHYVDAGQGLVAIVVREGGVDNYNYIYTDHLGSILTVTNNTGVIISEQNFDAWGRFRNKTTWAYTSPSIPTQAWLYRGFTGHEHLREFGLINMNGRLYDPVVARMLAPDNNVQAPDMTQNFNRYSYVLNNPLKYNDPNGEWWNYVFMAGAFVADYLSSALNGNADAKQSWENVNGAMSALSKFTSVNLVNVDLGAGFSFSLGLGVNYGTTGVGIGLTAGINYSSSNFDIGISGGIGYQFTNSTGGTGWNGSFGVGTAIGVSGFKAGLATNQFYGLGQNQRTGSFMFYGKDWGITYENDWQFGLPIADNGDRWRTTGFRVSVKDYSFGLNMFTGDPDAVNPETGEKYRPNHTMGGKPTYCTENGSNPDQFRLGALYFGYKDTRIGYTSEKIRHIFQNRFAHDWIQKGAAKHFQTIPGYEDFYIVFLKRNRYTTW